MHASEFNAEAAEAVAEVVEGWEGLYESAGGELEGNSMSERVSSKKRVLGGV